MLKTLEKCFEQISGLHQQLNKGGGGNIWIRYSE
ncbi:MAG: hypothetical protein SCABRO_02327 [Candidatus Scalindua brodae]|uniref:Uncharacterized protein n=1 Tax=Candidatus Scalindua brodae TaxID=237368 RepID=A0A0B0ELE9_9BACT|nr:MAG: hypothetical protein SCABRO_02327 [Candidatus Scalindua brodae]